MKVTNLQGHTDKIQKNQSRSVANQPSRGKKGGEAAFDVVDNRPEAIQLKMLQEAADNSPQVKRLKAIQYMADTSPQTKNAALWKGMTDGSPNIVTQRQEELQEDELQMKAETAPLQRQVANDEEMLLAIAESAQGQALFEVNRPDSGPGMVAQRQEANRIQSGTAGSAVIQRVTRYGTSSSGRVSKPPFDTAVAPLVLFSGPTYSSSGVSGAGGNHSSAKLGPNAILPRGDPADSSLPKAIAKAREQHPSSNFKAGHLLNGEFGGSGHDADNLTILSATGNANHKKFDNQVKNAVHFLKKAYEAIWDDGIDINSVTVGLDVNVKTNGQIHGTTYPDNCISTGLVCSVKINGNGPTQSDFEGSTTYENYTGHMKTVQSHLDQAAKTVDNPIT